MTSIVEIIQIIQRKNDPRKVYDMVLHGLLMNNLKKKKMGKKFTNYISKFYEGTRVRIESEFSKEFAYCRRVRQGCPTSPLLFDIFIHNLLDEIIEIEISRTRMKISGRYSDFRR